MRRGTGLLVGLLLTVTLSLLALSLLLTTVKRERDVGRTAGIQTLLAADGAVRVAQQELSTPDPERLGRSEWRHVEVVPGIDTSIDSPLLVGLSRGRADLRAGAPAAWGEVWRVGAAARRPADPGSRKVTVELVRQAAPAAAEVLVVAGGEVLALAAGEPEGSPLWRARGSGAALVPGSPDAGLLRSGAPGYAAYREAARAAPAVALLTSPGAATAVDARSGAPLFQVDGEPGAPRAPAPFVGDARLGCPPGGPECGWRSIALVAIGRSLIALEPARRASGRDPVLWRRELHAAIAGMAFGPLADAPAAVAVVAVGDRLERLDLATGEGIGELPRISEGGTLSAPALVDRDGDGLLETAYVGDGRGRLWRIDLRGDGRLPTLCGDAGESGPVIEAPAVLRAGIDPTTGADLHSIAWITSAEGHGRVSCVLDGLSRPAGGTAPPESIALDAPRAGSCAEPGSARLAGWTLALRPGEVSSSGLGVLDGSLLLTSSESCAGSPGCPPGGVRGRLYRLVAINGDPCEGASCCVRAPGATLRGAVLGSGGVEPRGLGSITVTTDRTGRTGIVVGRAGGPPLVLPHQVRPAVTSWRDGPGR